MISKEKLIKEISDEFDKLDKNGFYVYDYYLRAKPKERLEEKWF